MKKLLQLLFFYAVIPFNAIAQTVEFIEPRNVQNVPEAGFSTYSVGNNIYVLQKNFRLMAPVMYDLQLNVYDANRKPVGANIIDKTLEVGDANIFHDIFPLKDKLVMFKSEYSKASGSKMSYIYAYPFDEQGKRQKKIQLTTIIAESAFNAGNFGVNVSPDGTKIAVISEQPYDKEGMERCTISVFDEQIKLLWKKDYTFACESAKAPKNELIVNNSGVVFILKRIPVKKAHDQFSVFTFTGNGKSVIEKKIDLENGFTISSWKNVFSNEGDLQLAGFFYMNKKVGINVETPDGTFFLEVKALSGELTAIKSKKIRSTNIKAIQLISLADKGFVLAGESMQVKSTPKPGLAFENTFEYKAGYIHIIKLGTDGAVQWDYTVQRELASSNDGARFISHYTWVNGNDINVLFADYLSNHDDKKQFIEFGSRWINLYHTIDAEGKLKAETVIKDPRIGGKKGEYLLIPSTGSIYNNNKLFMLAARGQELVGTTISY